MVRALQVGRPRRRRAAGHRRHRGRHRTRTSGWPSASTPPAARSSCCSTSGSCSTPSARADVVYQLGAELHFLGEAPVLKITRADGQGRAQAAARRCRGRDRGLPTAGADPAGQRGASDAAQPAQPAPHGGRVLYATQGAADPPDVHALRQQGDPADATCATSSGSFRDVRASAPRRSSCGSARPFRPASRGETAAMPQNVAPFEFSDTAKQLRGFVYEFWCEQRSRPNLRAVHEGTGLDRRTILQATRSCSSASSASSTRTARTATS